MKIPIIVIAGPTASGKTSLSINLAKRFNGEIVSADSMQIYKAMNIGTAKPTKEEMDGIVHHLMDFVSPLEEYSVANYVEDAHRVIEDIEKRGKLPIIVGGTGLYINSLVDDVKFSEAENDEELRCELFEIAKKNGGEALIKMLSEFDEKSAESIHPNNTKKIVRAIEFYKTTGKTISEHNDEKNPDSRYNPLMLAISWDRDKLYERIEKRVDIMLREGLLEEIEALWQMGCRKNMQSMQGIGYRQLLDWRRGFSSLDEAIRIIKRDSRRYAKRQLTWFRRDKRINYIDAYGDIIEQGIYLAERFLSENV